MFALFAYPLRHHDVISIYVPRHHLSSMTCLSAIDLSNNILEWESGIKFSSQQWPLFSSNNCIDLVDFSVKLHSTFTWFSAETLSKMRALVSRTPIAAALRSATLGSQCATLQYNSLNILDRLPQPLRSRSFRIQYSGVSTSSRLTQTGRRNFQLSARNRDKREPQTAEPDPLERLEVRKVQQQHENEKDESGRDTKSGGKVAKAMTKGDTIAGKLLTTPSRLFKLLIPLTTINRKGMFAAVAAFWLWLTISRH